MVMVAKTDPSLCVVSTGDSPKSMKFGLSERMLSLTRLIKLGAYMLATDSLVNLLPITLLQIGVGFLYLEEIPLMEASSGSVFLTS